MAISFENFKRDLPGLRLPPEVNIKGTPEEVRPFLPGSSLNQQIAQENKIAKTRVTQYARANRSLNQEGRGGRR